MLYACAFSADGKFLATGDKVGHVVVWNVTTGQPVTRLDAPGFYTWDPRARVHSIGGIRSLAFSPDGRRLAIGGIGKIGNIDHLDGKARVEVYDWQSGKRTNEFGKGKFNGLVNHLEFHPQGRWLLGAGGAGDGFLLFFDIAANRALREEKVPMHCHSFAISESADTVYVAGHNRLLVAEMK
jgi:WD40 repeat protein